MKTRALLIAIAILCFAEGAAHAWLTPGSLKGFSGSGGGGSCPAGSTNSFQYNAGGGSCGGASITGLALGQGTGAAPTAYTGTSVSADQYISALSAAGVATAKNFRVDIPVGIQGTPNTSGVYPIAINFNVTFPADFAASGNAGNSVAKCSPVNGGPTNPSESDIWTIYCNSTQIGTVTLSTSCVDTWATTGDTSQSCDGTVSHGAVLSLLAPNPVSGANIGFILSGTR